MLASPLRSPRRPSADGGARLSPSRWADQGFKGISNLRHELTRALGDTDIIKNHYYGNYSFVDEVRVGECAVDKLVGIGDQVISRLARELDAVVRKKV